MKSLFVLPLAVALLIAAGGCASAPKARAQARDGADLSKFKTFALLPLSTSGPASDPGLMLRMAEPLRAALVEGLTARGYTEAAADAADFTVNTRGEVIPRTDITNWGYRGTYLFGPGGGMIFAPYQDISVNSYDEQTLIIEVFDRGTKELVWVGWMQRHAYRRKVAVEDVIAAARQVLEQFPARQ